MIGSTVLRLAVDHKEQEAGMKKAPAFQPGLGLVNRGSYSLR
jgi:hypothetical protein